MSRLRSCLLTAWQRNARWLLLLRPLEFVYRGIVHARRWLYRRGLLRVSRFPVPVVVVGNITPGGTGKTAVVVALLERLRERGLRAGVVSRGYGAAAAVSRPLLVEAATDPARCGDEPLMIFLRTGAPVAVCRDRARAVAALLANADIDIVLSDDGLQHYGLARDLEVLLYDAARAFGNGRCLPAGPLREPLSRLAEVDFVLARGEHVGPGAVEYTLGELVHLHTGERRPFSAAAIGAQPYAVAGVGNPGLFLAMLRTLGLQPEPCLFPDHHPYSAADFAGLEDRAILMTEKDAVKCRSLAPPNSWYAPVEATLPAELVEAVVALACRGVDQPIQRRA